MPHQLKNATSITNATLLTPQKMKKNYGSTKMSLFLNIGQTKIIIINFKFGGPNKIHPIFVKFKV